MTNGAVHLRLVPEPRAPRQARRALDEFDGLDDDVRSTAALMISELVTNSVRHAGLGASDRIELSISAANVLRVEVSDPGPGLLHARLAPTPGGDHGRGLFIVARLARRWGIDRERPSRVWFELDLHGDGRTRLL
jgi:anti-sigma regulatory factor (Ser/Thr protein kinase)